MEPPTQILVGVGLSFVASCWMLWNLNEEYRDQQPEHGHDRVTRRELNWYWNPDRNENVEKIRGKDHLAKAARTLYGCPRLAILEIPNDLDIVNFEVLAC
jgi:hypothetical protein